MSYRSRHGFCLAPTATQPQLNEGLRQASATTPVSDRMSLTGRFQDVIVAPIVRLFNRQRPLHIARFIATRVVDSFQGVYGSWTLTNTLEKAPERVSPEITNSDPTTAVLRITWVVRIVAACIHAVPNIVFRSFATSVSGISFYENGFKDTSTRCDRATNQNVGTDAFDGSAVAAAEPSHFVVGRAGIAANNHKAMESLARTIDKSWHISIISEIAPFAFTMSPLLLKVSLARELAKG